MDKNEIIQRLCAHEYVKRASIKDQNGKLIALVEPASFLDEEDVKLKQVFKKYLASHIPYSHLPTEFIFYKELPAEQDTESMSEDSKEKAVEEDLVNIPLSRDKTIESLNNMWCRALELKEVDIKNSFIALGGDSLRAMTIISEIQKNFDVDISFQQFFKFSNLPELRDYVLENIA